MALKCLKQCYTLHTTGVVVGRCRYFCDRTDHGGDTARVNHVVVGDRRSILDEGQSDQPPSSVTDFPSDVVSDSNSYRNQSRFAFRPSVDPETTSIILFPGQGSQFVGMGRQLLPYPGVQEIYQRANELLGYDLLKLCLEGPKKQLDQTVHCQPAVFVTSLAAVEKLSENYPNAILNCVSTSGFSVGEYAALVFAGALSFEDGLHLVKVRAEAMQKCSEEFPGGMLSILTTPSSKLKTACHIAREYCRIKLKMEEPVCCVANYLFPDGKVIAGSQEALEFIKKNARDFDLRVMNQLPVSGAFHTDLMKDASVALRAAMKTIDMTQPEIPVYSNMTSHKYHRVTDIPKLLAKQVYQPVKWEQTMHVLYSRRQELSFPTTYEVGPGRQLGMMLKKVNYKAYERYKSIDV